MARALLGPPRSASRGSTTPTARFPNHVQRAAPNSCSPEAPPGLLSIAGRVAHQGHPASVALHVLHRRGLAGWVLLSTHLGAAAPAGWASEADPGESAEEVAPPRPPLPSRNNGRSRRPHSGEDYGRSRAPPPPQERKPSLRRGGGIGNPCFPRGGRAVDSSSASRPGHSISGGGR